MNMDGRMMRMRVATARDCDLIASWLSESSDATSVGAHDAANPVDPGGLASELSTRPGHYFVVSTRDGQDVGLAEWSWVGGQGARAVTLGIVIGDARLWGLGYGMEAMYVLLAHLFYSVNVHRVQVVVSARNPQMITLLDQPGGPVLEGILRDYFYTQGDYEDGVVFGMLREEFDRCWDDVPEVLADEREGRERSSAAHRHLARRAAGDEDTVVHRLIREYASRSVGADADREAS